MRAMAEKNSEYPWQEDKCCCGQGELLIPCFCCGVCCTKYHVRLNLIEAHRIADGLRITWNEFVGEYTDQYYPGAESFLLQRRDGACVFLGCTTDTCHISRCLIHSFKPSSCRDWEPSLYRRDCREGLGRYWELEINSSGNVEGPAERLRDFHSFLQAQTMGG